MTEVITRPAVDVVSSRDDELSDLAAHINEGHREVLQGLSVALQRAIRVGEDLLQAQELVTPGTWMEWFTANVRFSRQAASNYMRLAEFQHVLPTEIIRPQITKGHQPGIARAVDYLKGLGVNRDSGSGKHGRRVDVEEVRRLHKAGVKKADIARLLGHSPSSITRVLLPQKTIDARRQEEKRKRKEAERALRREALAAQLANVSDELGEAYSLLRKTMQRCQQAHDKCESRVIRQSLGAALNRLLEAEQHLLTAERTPEETVYQKGGYA